MKVRASFFFEAFFLSFFLLWSVKSSHNIKISRTLQLWSVPAGLQELQGSYVHPDWTWVRQTFLPQLCGGQGSQWAPRPHFLKWVSEESPDNLCHRELLLWKCTFWFFKMHFNRCIARPWYHLVLGSRPKSVWESRRQTRQDFCFLWFFGGWLAVCVCVWFKLGHTQCGWRKHNWRKAA